MHWGVACITLRSNVYAMMMGSLDDRQIRHSPDYIDEANIQSVAKIQTPISYHVQSPALVLRGQMLTSYLSREPFAIAPPATTV